MPGDPNKYQYGNDPNGAANEAGKLNEQGRQAQARQGEQINTANADGSRQNSLNDREQQLGMAGMLRARATGQTPSIAGMRANQDMTRVAAEQSSAQASARGPAALALAQQGAAANTAGAQSAISNSAQINSAQERQQAEQAAMGAYTGIRQGDQSQQGQDFAQSAAQSQLNAQQRQQNDQYQLGNQAQAQGVQGMQLGANMNQDSADRADYWNQMQLEEQRNKERTSTLMGIAGMASSVAGTVGMMSDEQTKMPVNFGRTGAAPEGMGYGVSTQDAAPGYDTNSVTMSKMIAHQALADQHARESAAQVQDHTTGGGPMAYDGVEALKRRDSEDLGLIQAKERNGVALTAKEDGSKASLQHRAGQEKAAVQGDKAAATKALAKDAPPGVGATAATGLQGIGKALTSMSESSRPKEAWKPTMGTHYAMPQPAAPVTWSDEKAKRPAGKMSMAELMKAADAMKAGTEAQRSTLKSGPAVGGDHLEREGRAMAEHTEAQRAMLDSGPSVGGHEDTGAEDYDRRGSGMGRALRTTSDDHAKVAIAQREAFSAGLAHANQAADTGKIGEVPEYMRSSPPSNAKQQPSSRDRKASATVEGRADRSQQSAANQQAGRELAKADITSLPGMGGTLNGAGAIRQDEIAEEQQARANLAHTMGPKYAQPRTFVREHPEDTTSDERAKVGHLGKEMPVGEMADAARSLKAVPYAYKPGFSREEGQKPGEVNVGPVAQEMQKSPVAATAVKQDSPDGLRSIDIPKYTKVLGGIAASQQEQLDEQQRQISFMASRLRSKR